MAGEESSDEEMGNTEDSDWRERAARARREQRAAEAKRRRGSGIRLPAAAEERGGWNE